MNKKSNGNLPQDALSINKLDVPFPLIYGGSHIELFGNTKLSFEGKYRIIEYTTENLKLKISKQELNICGANLSLSNLQNGSFLLTGSILSIEFSR
ncbi:MAG: YabP/YqfC family sporulation protein [Acutalibacteraceae bacterium]|nr:YabP/YqfC family sporulation protein [Acutalibacteraceae bacterium]